MKLLETTKVGLLTRALDVYALRQKVIASNIANIATPGYAAQTVRFEEHLADAGQQRGLRSATTDPNHFSVSAGSDAGPVPTVVGAPAEGSSGNDPYASGINNVDVDHEMAELAKNQIRFKFAARLLADTFRGIQKSIRGQT